MAIKTVAVAGGTGTVGKHVVRELVKAGFSVTLLSRSADTPAPPGVVAVKAIDYASLDSIKAALAGQDALVSTVTTLAVDQQRLLVDGAAAAGVKRFVPSEFGINTRKAQGTAIGKMVAAKVAVADYAAEVAAKSGGAFSWTGISTGLFFDWGLDQGLLGFDLKARTATIYDSGNEPTQTSSLGFVGRSVAAVLRQADKPGDKTANEYLEVASFTPSQNDVRKIVEEASGGSPFATVHVDTATLKKSGEDKMAKGDFSSFLDLLCVWQFQDGSGHTRDVLGGNKLLGLEVENLEAIVQDWVAKRK